MIYKDRNWYVSTAVQNNNIKGNLLLGAAGWSDGALETELRRRRSDSSAEYNCDLCVIPSDMMVSNRGER